ncbi:MAG: hypothetical protein QM760_13840 [Nibricoccus sp.]
MLAHASRHFPPWLSIERSAKAMKTLLVACLLISLAALGLAIRSLQSLNRNANASAEELKSELADTQRRLHAAESKLAALSGHVDVLQARSAGTTIKEKNTSLPVVKKVSLPGLTGGSYTLENDTVVYGSDAKLRLTNDVIVSSPSGVMVSDLNQKMVVGDLTLETQGGAMHADGAIVDVSKHRVTAKSMSFTTKKKPNQSLEPTTTTITPPAAQESRRP